MRLEAPKVEGKKFTSEEIAKFEEQRILSDAELIKSGAKIEVDEKGNRVNLSITENQQVLMGEENKRMTGEKEYNEKRERLGNIINSLRRGDHIEITLESYQESGSDKKVQAIFSEYYPCKLKVKSLEGFGYTYDSVFDEVKDIELLKE